MRVRHGGSCVVSVASVVVFVVVVASGCFRSAVPADGAELVVVVLYSVGEPNICTG